MAKPRSITRLHKVSGTKNFETNITLGEVIDTNDPQQMGRLRVLCPAFGDSDDMLVGSLPWAMYASPFAGALDSGTRGRGSDSFQGPVAYGMWNIPKVGAHVLVACIDGNPSQRFWFAAVFPQYLTDTMPHGRFTYSTQVDGKPEGPMSSTERPVEPLYTNQTTAFTNPDIGVDPRKSFEYRTRGADNQVAALTKDFFGIPDAPVISELADDRFTTFTEADGEQITSNQGYGKSRIEPDVQFPNTDGVNWDPQSYSWTSPGFHAISMEDRAEGCRIRIRTTGGMQVILDDTNERIYIGTAEGQTWVEMDEKGTIDVFTDQTFSVRSKGDINFTTDQTFRVQAKQGIHLASEDEVRIDAKGSNGGDLNVHAKNALRVHSEGGTFLQSDDVLNVKTASNIFLQSNGEINIKAGSNTFIQTDGQLNLKAAGMILGTAAQIHLNGPDASPASAATAAQEKAAFYASRVPDHESWARVYTKKTDADTDGPNSSVPEYGYDDPQVGRGSAQRDINFDRNPLWKR